MNFHAWEATQSLGWQTNKLTHATYWGTSDPQMSALSESPSPGWLTTSHGHADEGPKLTPSIPKANRSHSI